MSVEIVFEPEVFNPVYLPTYQDKARFLHLYGGAGSGKSIWAAQKLLLRSLEENGNRFLMVRKVARTIRKSQYQLMKDLISQFGLGGLMECRDGEMEIHVPSTNTTIVSAGMDDPEKLKSIAGITGVWIEEATELSARDLNQIDLRLRGACPNYFQTILSYNPIDYLHWLRVRFHDRVPPGATLFRYDDVTVLRTTYKDNRFLDAEYRRKLEELAEVDPTYHQIYTLGEWATPGNIIYSRWDIAEGSGFHDDLLYGLDFGFQNQTALIEVKLHDGQLYLRELLYQSGLTNHDLVQKMAELVPDKTRPVYADAAEPARITELQRAGFNVLPANKAVAPGIDYVLRFILHAHPDSENLIRELRAYKRRVDKNGNVLDEPVKFMDHLMDALRYAAFTHGSIYWNTHGMNAELVLPSVRGTRRKTSLLDGYDY